MARSKHRFGVGLVLITTFGAIGGCEADTRKPMDDPLTAQDAMEANDRMQRDADALLREHESRLLAPPAPPGR